MQFDCGSIAIEAEDSLGGGAFPRNCNCWPCQICAPRKRARLIREIAAGHPNRFITITCRENQFATPEIGAERLAWFWKIVVQRWRRLKSTNQCEFAVVREAQENGWPHLHIAWRGGWVDWEWLRDQAAELLNSPHVDIRFIYNPKQAARYIGKYLGKAPHQFGTLKRYWFSAGYRKERLQRHPSVFRSELRFRDYGRSMSALIADLKRQNRVVQYLANGAIAWGRFWREKPVPLNKDPPRIRYRSGIPHLYYKEGWGP